MNSFDAVATLNELSDAFFAVDGEWRFTFVNAAAARQWSLTAESLVGRVMWDAFPGLVGTPFEEAYREAGRTRVPCTFTLHSEETQRWYSVRVFPNDGGLAAIFHDTTDLKVAEDELARVTNESEREQRTYRTALSNSGDLLFVLDVDGRFVFANAPMLKLYGKSLAEMVGRDLRDIGRDDEVASQFMRQVKDVVTSGKPVRHETAYATAIDGGTYEYILMPVFGAGGTVEAVAGSARDTTERLKVELAAVQETRRKDEFIATLAHELRNPLAPIRNALEVARLAKGNDVAVEYAHGVMDRQMTLMIRLIDDLLDLSRLNLGKIELKRYTIDLGTVLESAIETSRPHFQQAKVALVVDINDDALCVDADSTRMTQIFANLLTNAAKFSAPGSKVVVSAGVGDGFAEVRVTDTGIGMSAEMLTHVFDSFTQEADALYRTDGGLGIGLTLVKGLVELHGGTVSATSKGKGLGSEFTVRLPLATGEQTHEHLKNRKLASSTSNWHRILVVDDNKDSATSLSMMLNFMGHDTRTANDGLHGLEVAEVFRPDVCLLDIGMPNLNGFDMARRLREQPWGEQILLIALSGWGQEHDKERSADAGFDMHLVKPIDPATLTAVLEARHQRGNDTVAHSKVG
ncbi:MAG: PAS domain-containing protein [Gemmatimonadaceae bacterium]